MKTSAVLYNIVLQQQLEGLQGQKCVQFKGTLHFVPRVWKKADCINGTSKVIQSRHQVEYAMFLKVKKYVR